MPLGLLSLLFLIITNLTMANSNSPAPKTLNITAISASKGASTIECWQLSAPFATSSTAGVSGASFAQLGKTGNTSYAIIPKRFNGGLHNAPAVQYVAFISGLAHVTLPNSTESATIKGGRDGLILAADTADVSRDGHSTIYPSNQETHALQIPTEGGVVPPHTVLYQGPCRGGDNA